MHENRPIRTRHPFALDESDAAGWHWRLARQCPRGLEDTGGQAASATRPQDIDEALSYAAWRLDEREETMSVA